MAVQQRAETTEGKTFGVGMNMEGGGMQVYMELVLVRPLLEKTHLGPVRNSCGFFKSSNPAYSR